jgi:hypothetical protein
MIKVHVISDLWYDDNEWSDPVDELLPDCDLVIVNGNCGFSKRTMLYIETLCRKYPEKQFIYNLGRKEVPYQKSYTQIPNGLTVRQLYSDLWPKNLHYSYKKPFSLTIKNTTLDILCLHGYPNVADKVENDLNWKSTSWHRYFYHGITHDQAVFKAPQAADVYHGHWPIWSTPELCREDHNNELITINDWLAQPSDGHKVLITALGPINDSSLANIEYTMYDGIQPDYWFVGGSSVNTMLGNCHLHGNSGRGSLARNTVFTMESS